MEIKIKRAITILLAVCFSLLLTSTAVTAMDVYFENRAGEPLQITVAYYDPNGCPGTSNSQQWHVVGWYQLAPGESEWLFSTTSTTFYYYAEATIGSDEWSGTDKYAYIRRGPPIDQCINNVPQNTQIIGLREVNTGGLYDTFTYSLIK